MAGIDPVQALARECRKAGGQRAWAAKNGVSAAYVSDVLSEKRDAGPRILKALGILRQVTYRRSTAKGARK